MPNPWGLPRYNTRFDTYCRMDSSDYQELKNKITNRNPNDSDSTFDTDAPLHPSTEIGFWISSDGDVKLRIDGLTHTVNRVSDLPGVDRVLMPSDATNLSDKQRELYGKFTDLLVSNKIQFKGPFSCASHISGAKDNDRDARIRGDRPVPVFVDNLDPMLRLDRVLTFSLGRTRGRRLMHCSPSGLHYPNEYASEEIIYLGTDGREKTASAAATGNLGLHDRLCTQLREFSTEIVSLSPLVTCGTDKIQAFNCSVCNCFYCRNHSPINWSLEVIYTDYEGRERSTFIESLSFYDGGMETLRADAPKDGAHLSVIAGRLFVDHNGRLERWAVKQSRIGELERTATRYGLSDRDKLLFTVVNAPIWATKPSKCYLGGDSIYDPDHYAPCASEVMGVTFWYTPSGSWVTVGHTLVINNGLYHLEKANKEGDIVEVRNIRPDVKVVGKLKKS